MQKFPLKKSTNNQNIYVKNENSKLKWKSGKIFATTKKVKKSKKNIAKKKVYKWEIYSIRQQNFNIVVE